MRRPAVIVDMDGTLANVSGIRHLLLPTEERRWKDFEAFHRSSVDCPPNPEVVEMVRASHAIGNDIVIVTARRARWRHHTAWWLALHEVPSTAMFMRGDKDGRADVEVKRDILNAIRHSWEPIHAIDDNPSIVALWQAEGIPTTIVPGWS